MPASEVDYDTIRAVVGEVVQDVVDGATVPLPDPVDLTDYERIESIVAGVQVTPVVTEKYVQVEVPVEVPGPATVEYVDRPVEVAVEVPVEVGSARPPLWKDIAERVIRTFLVTFVTVFAAGFTPEIDMDGVKALAIAGATAGGTALLGLVTQYIGNKDTASVIE